MLNVTEYVKLEALRQAGIPVLASELDDTGFTENVITPALHDYFIYAPYEHAKTYSFAQAGTLDLDIPDLATEKTNWPSGLAFEFVGLTGFSYNSGALGGSGTTEVIEEMIDDLVGDNQDSQMQGIIQGMMGATIQDMTVADELLNYDQVLQKLHIFAPGPGSVGIIWGFYLDDVNYVKPSHRLAFSKICSLKFLELVVSARSSVVISSEVTLDITALDAKKMEIQENFANDMEAITTPVITWG